MTAADTYASSARQRHGGAPSDLHLLKLTGLAAEAPIGGRAKYVFLTGRGARGLNQAREISTLLEKTREYFPVGSKKRLIWNCAGKRARHPARHCPEPRRQIDCAHGISFNQRSARALGTIIPEVGLLRADRVIG